MIGQRGVPATFGGVEHHVEELGSRLAQRGHRVTVYCRPNYVRTGAPTYRGMRIRSVPTIGTKHLDAIVHSALSTGAAMFDGIDVVHYHALGPGLPSFLPRYLSRAKVVQTIHGLDSRRAKWGPAARFVLDAAERLSARVPDATIVVARDLAEHYRARYGRCTWRIPNGVVPPKPRAADEIVRRYGLRPGRYVLFVGRLVPEKAPDLLIRAFRAVPGDVRLVLAGGSSFTDRYTESLHRAATSDPRVLLTGYVHGPTLEELYTNAGVFALPSLLEGLPLTLLEAASYGIPIVASDIPPHLEVLFESGPGRRMVAAGDSEALGRALRADLANGNEERPAAEAAAKDVLARYDWDRVTDQTEAVYRTVLAS
jgi:glycosyltransferase involved in cell wall biosynthesis